jgi:AMME syndrome candidate gene 1 protein
LTKKAAPSWPEQLKNVPIPLFVTWTYTKNHDLRGCIGTFAHQELKKVLPEYTLISAFNDDRFGPISIDEVEHLTVAVSLLINFQKNKKAFDWQVGKHGIEI